MIDFISANANRIYFETEEDYLQIRNLLNDPAVYAEAKQIHQVLEYRNMRDHFNRYNFYHFDTSDGKYVEFGLTYCHIYKLIEKYWSEIMIQFVTMGNNSYKICFETEEDYKQIVDIINDPSFERESKEYNKEYNDLLNHVNRYSYSDFVNIGELCIEYSDVYESLFNIVRDRINNFSIRVDL